MSTSPKPNSRAKRRRVARAPEEEIEAEYGRSGLPDIPEAKAHGSVASTASYNYQQMDDIIEQYTVQHNANSTTTPELVCCPRAYEEAFLREPIGAERPCASNAQCQGLKIMGSSGFVLREFTMPGSPMPAANDKRSLCLMCRRYEIARLYFLYESRREPLCANIAAAPYYNLVGVPGEYNISDTIVSEGKYTGLALPVVCHSRSAYTQTTVNGVKAYIQTGMGSPGDKHTESAFLARRAALAKNQ